MITLTIIMIILLLISLVKVLNCKDFDEPEPWELVSLGVSILTGSYLIVMILYLIIRYLP